MTKSDFKRIAKTYPHIVEWSDEDKCWIGRCPPLAAGGVHGATMERTAKVLADMTWRWVKIYVEDGTPLPPPNFILRDFPPLNCLK